MELNQCINYLLTTAQHAVFQEMSAQLSKCDVLSLGEKEKQPEGDRRRTEAGKLYNLRCS